MYVRGRDINITIIARIRKRLKSPSHRIITSCIVDFTTMIIVIVLLVHRSIEGK